MRWVLPGPGVLFEQYHDPSRYIQLTQLLIMIFCLADQNENETVVKSSTLSAEAPEFVPKYGIVQQQQLQQQEVVK